MTLDLTNVSLLRRGAIPQLPFNAVILNNALPYWWSNSVQYATKVIACDGGAVSLKNFLTSKVLDDKTLSRVMKQTSVVGDFDTLSEQALDFFKTNKIAIQKVDSRFGSDSEHALNSLKSDEITFLFGGSGRRLDHTLNNVSLASRYGSNVVLVDQNNLSVVLPKGETTFKLDGVIKVGVFPLRGKTRCTTSGLKNDLNVEIIDFGDNVLVSAEVQKDDTFSVEVDLPSLVVIQYQ